MRLPCCQNCPKYCFHGALDNFAREQVAETTNESIGIFALLIGLNATISVIQSSELDVVFASVQLGELLDPINDEVERLSSAIVWALGTLFLQNVVLGVAANSIFKWMFFAISLVTISALLLVGWGRFRNMFCGIFGVSTATVDRCRDLLIRIFILAAIFRFIVPVFVAISFLVSQLLLETEINKHKEDLSSFSDQVSIDDSLPTLDVQSLAAQKARKESELNDLKEPMASYTQESEQLDAEIKELNREAGLRRYLPENLGGGSPKEELVAAKARRKEIRRETKKIEDQIHDGEKELECIERRLAGEDCDSLLDKISSAASYTRLKEIVDKAPDMMTSLIKLLMALVVKNILLPIAFLMIAVKCGLPIVRYSAFRQEPRDFGGPLLKGKSEKT